MTRTSFVIITLLLAAKWSFGQYDSKGENEISRFKAGFMWYFNGLRPAKPDKARKYDRLIFDLTYNDWTGERTPFQNHWASIGLNTNVMFDIPLTKGNTVSIGTGFSHQLLKIRHDNHLIGDDLTQTTTYLAKDSSDAFYKSVFGGNSFSVPLEIRFRKESWRHFKFHMGGKFGYQANLYNKYVTRTDNGKDVVKRIGFPDMNRWVYSAHVRFGLRNWAFYGSYSFNTLFADKSSTQLTVFQFGLSISLY